MKTALFVYEYSSALQKKEGEGCVEEVSWEELMSALESWDSETKEIAVLWGVKTALTRQELGPNRIGKYSCEPASAEQNRGIGHPQLIALAAINNDAPSPRGQCLASGGSVTVRAYTAWSTPDVSDVPVTSEALLFRGHSGLFEFFFY